MKIDGTAIEDTDAEAFSAWATKLIVTAADRFWIETAVREATGYGTSVIGCDAEAGMAEMLDADRTPDGRPGAAILLFARNSRTLAAATVNRAGQSLLTCPTVCVFAGIEPGETPKGAEHLDLGSNLRYFGDGFEQEIHFAGRRCWRIPVMDGYFVVEDTAVAVKGVAGGNLLVCGVDQRRTLAAALRAARAVGDCPDTITPFPAGVVRSGSKVGSRYQGQIASTNEAYCPDLRGVTGTRLPQGVGCVYEVIINGLTLDDVKRGMRLAIRAACGPGIVAITAASFGGKLGKINLNLHAIMGTMR